MRTWALSVGGALAASSLVVGALLWLVRRWSDRAVGAVGGHVRGGINGFAAGALLVMLVDTMIPDASGKVGLPAGLVTVLGFAVAAAIST